MNVAVFGVLIIIIITTFFRRFLVSFSFDSVEIANIQDNIWINFETVEVRRKYSATRLIFNSLLRVWKYILFTYWQSNSFVVLGISCPPLPPIANGDVSPNYCTESGNVFNQDCLYSCHGGYRLNGQSRRKCQANGQWDVQTIPTCDRGNSDR